MRGRAVRNPGTMVTCRRTSTLLHPRRDGAGLPERLADPRRHPDSGPLTAAEREATMTRPSTAPVHLPCARPG